MEHQTPSDDGINGAYVVRHFQRCVIFLIAIQFNVEKLCAEIYYAQYISLPTNPLRYLIYKKLL